MVPGKRSRLGFGGHDWRYGSRRLDDHSLASLVPGADEMHMPTT
jgi:hypothetical protein